MRITVQHSLKLPDAEQYSSRQHSVALETTVPEEVVAKGKAAIGEYVAKVTAEVRSYVEEALAGIRVEQQEREPAPASPPEPAAVESRRAPPGRMPPRRPRRVPPASNGHATTPSNGARRAAPTGETASLKQVAYLRSLAREAGYSNDQLAMLAEEVVGRNCPLSALLKREASMVIETLKANAA